MLRRKENVEVDQPTSEERLYEGLHFLHVASKSFLDSTVPNQSVDERVELKKAVEEARVLLVDLNPDAEAEEVEINEED